MLDTNARIKKLLGNGLPPSAVAEAVGVDPSLVSQLLADEDFKREVLTAKAARAEQALERDARWDRIEDKVLEKAEQMLPLISRPRDLIAIAQVANGAKRRTGDLGGIGESNAPVVNIVLPNSAVIHFQMNPQAQVVSVEGRSMMPLPASHLNSHLQRLKERQEAAGIVDVEVSTAKKTERKKVESTLAAIGCEDMLPPDIPLILPARIPQPAVLAPVTVDDIL